MSSRMRRLLPYIALGIVYLVWGSTYLAIRLVVRELPPFAAASIRFGSAGIVMALLAFATSQGERPSPKQILHYAIVGILLLGISNALVMWSETRIPSGIAALIVAAVPLWITLLDGLRPGGQPWTARVWLGTAVGLLGVALVAHPEVALAGYWKGVVALEIACLTWAAGSVYSQMVPQRLPLLSAAAIEMVAASVVLILESRLAGEDLGAFRHASAQAWGGLLYLAVFGSLVAFTAFAFALNELPATTVGTYAYVNPVVAVILGSVVLGEAVSPFLILGAGLIILAVVLSTRRPSPRPISAPLSGQEAGQVR
jgi:drug/metabolite transporter (DMT)-like permease